MIRSKPKVRVVLKVPTLLLGIQWISLHTMWVPIAMWMNITEGGAVVTVLPTLKKWEQTLLAMISSSFTSVTGNMRLTRSLIRVKKSIIPNTMT